MNKRLFLRIVTALLLLGVAMSLFLWSALPPSIPARGTFHDFEIDTTVDSESAKYYIESYAQGRVDSPQLHQGIEKLKRDFGDRIPSHLDLRRPAQTQSVDFAALFFADQLLSLDRNAIVNRRFRMNLDRVLREETVVVDTDGIVIILVPGYDYKENGHLTGADLKAQVAILSGLGFQVELLEVDPVGTVLECADVIENALESLGEEQILIAGPSSAGPAIGTALSRLGTGSGVLAWLNLGGTLQGVPLLDWFQKFPQRLVFDLIVWVQDWRHESFESLTNRVLRICPASRGNKNGVTSG